MYYAILSTVMTHRLLRSPGVAVRIAPDAGPTGSEGFRCSKSRPAMSPVTRQRCICQFSRNDCDRSSCGSGCLCVVRSRPGETMEGSCRAAGVWPAVIDAYYSSTFTRSGSRIQSYSPSAFTLNSLLGRSESLQAELKPYSSPSLHLQRSTVQLGQTCYSTKAHWLQLVEIQ